MAHYLMADVVSEINERENCPSSSKYERFVGLEHYISGEVEIRQYGSTDKLESTMKIFQSGDILVARRKRIVNEIDEIVKIVRFPGWQDTDQGRTDVEKALRKVFIEKRCLIMNCLKKLTDMWNNTIDTNGHIIRYRVLE